MRDGDNNDKLCEVMYMKINDWYDIGIKLLSFGVEHLALGVKKSSFGSPKSIESHLWDNFGT